MIPDPVDVFIKVHSIPISSYPYRYDTLLLPCHVQRSICGLAFLGTSITERVREKINLKFEDTESNDIQIESLDAGLTRLLPLTVSCAGDYRIFRRLIQNEITLTTNITKILEQLSQEDSRRIVLERRAIPKSLAVFLDSDEGKQQLFELFTKTCGRGIPRERVREAVPKVIIDIRSAFPMLNQDADCLYSSVPIDPKEVDSVIVESLKKRASQDDGAPRRVSVKSIYREAELELLKKMGRI